MNSPVVFGIVRHLLTIGAGALASRGVIGENESETLVGAVLALVAIGWSAYEKRVAARKLEEARE
jgi:hypothetical protein